MTFDPITYAILLKKLSQINFGVVYSKEPPKNINNIWYDTTNNEIKIFNPNTNKWEELDMGIKKVDFTRILYYNNADLTKYDKLRKYVKGVIDGVDFVDNVSDGFLPYISNIYGSKILILKNETMNHNFLDKRHNIYLDDKDTKSYGAPQDATSTPISIDYGKVYDLVCLFLYGNISSPTTDASVTCSIKISNDNSNWTEIFRRSADNYSSGDFMHLVYDVSLRYLKVEFSAGNAVGNLSLYKVIGLIK